ncbi:exodeoxyribonuclease VII large subunit [Pleionea sediminis]|uniref:exodeoxyribonuclease VII large subunit n=1 Tax=Pleionea sediminis TaxID=2569479 RepID=UPI0011857670|nr:exodeoxyribonuclease VII large subunit [Pleionea sediminis]
MLKPVLQPKKPSEKKYLSVSELNRKVKGLLENQAGQVLIEGEISNFVAAASGHWYFTLKDASAQVKCTMWKGRNQHLKFRPEGGMQIYLRAKVTLYEARGDYQLAVDYMEPAGLGNLQMQFEQLKEKLNAAGLFDPRVKKAIPQTPQRVGVVTSPTGAAIRDIISVMHRRFPMTEIIVYPCQVQGKKAHHSIINAIESANQRKEVDVLLITRGGGSLEDLWCFNEEALAHTIHQSVLPTISAVGHEIDFTIADFVADVRTPTPSAAAELVTRDQNQVAQNIDDLGFRLIQSMDGLTAELEARLSYLLLRLADPEPLLESHASELEGLYVRLKHAMTSNLQELKESLHSSQLALLQYHPEKQLSQVESQNNALKKRLSFAARTYFKNKQNALTYVAAQLNTVSPLATLDRGYSITLHNETLINSSSQVSVGQTIETRLKTGRIFSKVVETE